MPPVIELGSQDQILISFDEMTDDRSYLRYSLTHCDAAWRPSGLVDAEYLDGFNEGLIEDYAFSRATQHHYVNYQLRIPNAEMQPLLSGNYLVKVWREDDPDNILLQARFSLSEASMALSTFLTTRTDVDYNDRHQQLEVTLDMKEVAVFNPFGDMQLRIVQNGRQDTERVLTAPQRVAGKKAFYAHQPGLIFLGGNEYRRMEVSSTRYPGMHVERVDYLYPNYHFYLFPDQGREESPYTYDQTQHGRFWIREYDSDNSDTEADYVVVHFYLDEPERRGQEIWLEGDVVERRRDGLSLMRYNHEERLYETTLLLKQGAYNYQYVTNGPDLEGNHYQTNNEYDIRLYYRLAGDRYDRLAVQQTVYLVTDR